MSERDRAAVARLDYDMFPHWVRQIRDQADATRWLAAQTHYLCLAGKAPGQ